jgi:phosphate transport system substrate-binding protein
MNSIEMPIQRTGSGRQGRSSVPGSRAIFAALIAFAGLGLLSITGCNLAEEEKTADEPKLATTDMQSFSGAGSTFVAPLIDRWTADFSKLNKVQINYRAIGSGAGISELRKGNPTFAASDAPLGDDQLKGLPPILQIPVTAGPVCVTYNLPGVSAPLRFSGRTLAGIFSGEIISWQDSAIASENPGAKLPHAAIIVIHRSDGSGTTSIFTDFLSSVSPEWSKKTGHGLTVEWPAGIGADGSKTLLATVKQNPGTIGYVELNYAKEAGLPVALVQNRAGEYVVPSPQSAALAVVANEAALEKDLRAPIVDPPASAKGAYPISGMTYVLIPKDDSVLGHRQAFKDFIAYAIGSGQESAEGLSYARLPAAVQQRSQSLLAQLTDNGQPLK